MQYFMFEHLWKAEINKSGHALLITSEKNSEKWVVKTVLLFTDETIVELIIHKMMLTNGHCLLFRSLIWIKEQFLDRRSVAEIW